MKKCSKCGIEKDESGFSKGKARPCKSCCSIAQKEYYSRDLEKSRERAKVKAKKYYHEKVKTDPEKLKRIRMLERIRGKKYRLRNAEKRKESQKKYYDRNKYKISERAKNYRTANGDKIKTRQQEWYYSDLEKSRKLRRESAKRNYNSEKATKRSKEWRQNNIDLVKKTRKEWEIKNREKHLADVRKRTKRMRDELREAYLKKQLINEGLPKPLISHKLIELKKLQILTKRTLKQIS